MKILNAALSAFVASSLIAAPIAAHAAPAADARSTSAVKGEELAGFGWGWIFAVLVALGVIIVVVTDSDENAPLSP